MAAQADLLKAIARLNHDHSRMLNIALVRQVGLLAVSVQVAWVIQYRPIEK